MAVDLMSRCFLRFFWGFRDPVSLWLLYLLCKLGVKFATNTLFMGKMCSSAADACFERD